jgi:hypothetical protein
MPDTRSTHRTLLAAIVFLLAIGFLLFTEHRAHVIAFLPWLFLLVCPLMHLFMHGGHGHDHGHGDQHVERTALDHSHDEEVHR